ncbi:hypothetical protein OFO07_05600 [Campylobacter sp. JMF_06 NA1]|uniref:hypothetical protein n=1 Tax=Campylobacter sp. JMF_06 NA1 TaxID=2983823 RepID=UPI0022E9EFFF|nr:hypothetical protein [Campylobacter sp. JMF_06 NA1]MDA3078394.1 hypothetical protein [Campylobacter sp. JMF_06 NA1]
MSNLQEIEIGEIWKYMVSNIEEPPNFCHLVENAAKELNIEIIKGKINIHQANQIYEFLSQNNEISTLTNDKDTNFIPKFILIILLSFGGYQYGRYNVEKEFAFIDECIGGDRSDEQIRKCINGYNEKIEKMRKQIKTADCIKTQNSKQCLLK